MPSERRPRRQRRVVMEFNPSIADGLDALAEHTGDTPQGVIRRAVNEHLRSNRDVIDADVFDDPSSMDRSSQF